MADLSLIGLRLLREVAARGSFTAAADALGYTQSAISRQAASLESAAGAPLFERGARGVRLTGPGRTLLPHAVAVTERVEIAVRELAGAEAVPALRVGAFPTALAALVPRAVVGLRNLHPGAKVQLREGTTPTQLRRLESGASQLAVLAAFSEPEFELSAHAVVEHLLDDRLLVALARDHPLAGHRTVQVDDLRDEPWVAASADPDRVLLGVWPALAWQPAVAYVAREWTAKLGLVAAGLGVTVVPGLAATAIRRDISLVRVLGGDPGARTVSLAIPHDLADSPQARDFGAALHVVAAELALEIEQRLED